MSYSCTPLPETSPSSCSRTTPQHRHQLHDAGLRASANGRLRLVRKTSPSSLRRQIHLPPSRPGFMIQGGDPRYRAPAAPATSSTTITPSWTPTSPTCFCRHGFNAGKRLGRAPAAPSSSSPWLPPRGCSATTRSFGQGRRRGLQACRRRYRLPPPRARTTALRRSRSSTRPRSSTDLSLSRRGRAAPAAQRSWRMRDSGLVPTHE